MRYRLPAIPLSIVALLLFVACGGSSRHRVQSLEDVQEWVRPEYAIESEAVYNEIGQQVASQPVRMYADSYTRQYYQTAQPLVWATRMGISNQADTLLTWMEKADDLGLSPEVFQVDTIRALHQQARSYDFSTTSLQPPSDGLTRRRGKGYRLSPNL